MITEQQAKDFLAHLFRWQLIQRKRGGFHALYLRRELVEEFGSDNVPTEWEWVEKIARKLEAEGLCYYWNHAFFPKQEVRTIDSDWES